MLKGLSHKISLEFFKIIRWSVLLFHTEAYHRHKNSKNDFYRVHTSCTYAITIAYVHDNNINIVYVHDNYLVVHDNIYVIKSSKTRQDFPLAQS